MKRIFYSFLLFFCFASCSQGRTAVPPETSPVLPEENDAVPGPQDRPGNAEVLTIGLIADPQYADVDDRGPRHYRSPLRKLPEAIATFNEKKVDRVVCLGDIVDRNPADLDALLPLFAQSKAPVRHIMGNHDFSHLKDVSGHIAKLGMPALYYTEHLRGWFFIFLNTNEFEYFGRLSCL